jgi:hypothetical protein
MPCDNEEAAIPEPAIAKEVVAEITLEQHEKKSEGNGGRHLKKEVAAPFGVLAIEKSNVSKIKPKAE